MIIKNRKHTGKSNFFQKLGKPKLNLPNFSRDIFSWGKIYSILIGSTAILAVFLTIFISASGAELTHLEKKEQTLIIENRILLSQSLKSSSLSSLEEKAQELGFISPEKIVYLKAKEPVAQLR